MTTASPPPDGPAPDPSPAPARPADATVVDPTAVDPTAVDPAVLDAADTDVDPASDVTSDAPTAPPDDKPADAPGPAGRAGRDLPAAVAVGVSLALAVVVPLFTAKPVFVAVVALAIGLGVRELVVALRRGDLDPPEVPLQLGGALMLLLAYVDGPEGLVLGLLLTVTACAAWDAPSGARRHRRVPPAARSAVPRRPRRAPVADLGVSALIATYAPFCAGFAVLLAAPDDGAQRVVAFIATVVCSDVGGYTAGVLAGRHPMAPSVSPKKSWEGFAGSASACAVAGALMLPLMFGSPVWHGLLFGLAVVVTATLGDLGESMMKRDLGIKDMGSLLPGHGGLMDRLDSLLPTAPVAWLFLSASAPVPA